MGSKKLTGLDGKPIKPEVCAHFRHKRSVSSHKHNQTSSIHPSEIFATLDGNRNGYITMEEMENNKEYLLSIAYSGKPTEHQKEESQIRNIFQNLDLNVNEMIEPEEIDESLKGRTLFD